VAVAVAVPAVPTVPAVETPEPAVPVTAAPPDTPDPLIATDGVVAAAPPSVTFDSIGAAVGDEPAPTQPTMVIVWFEEVPGVCDPDTGVCVGLVWAAAVAAAHAKINPLITDNLMGMLLLLRCQLLQARRQQ
jgi:hypothetical protein